MSIDDPESLIESLCSLERETEWCEFKHNKMKKEDLCKYISALSNSAIISGKEHSYLVFGIKDGTHEIIGTNFSFNTENVGNDTLLFWLQSRITPSILIEHFHAKFGEKKVEGLRIGKPYNHPTRFNNRAFIRVDSSLSELSKYPEKERTIWNHLRGTSFEYSLASKGMDITKIYNDFETKELIEGLSEGRSTQNIEPLIQEGLIKENISAGFDVTNLLVVVAAKNLKDWPGFEHKGLRLIVYNGTTKFDSKNEILGKRGYFKYFNIMIKKIMEHIPYKEELTDGIREKNYIIPQIAIRELLANSIVHQDIEADGGGPMVEIYDDRIVFTNPGRPLIDAERFIDHPTSSRNEKFADLMRRLGICEKRGSGMDRVFDEIEKIKLPPPHIKITDHHTVITLYGPKKFVDMPKDERIDACYWHSVLCVEKNDFMTNKSLRKRFGLTDKQSKTATNIINDAIEKGTIKPKELNQPKNKSKYVPFWY